MLEVEESDTVWILFYKILPFTPKQKKSGLSFYSIIPHFALVSVSFKTSRNLWGASSWMRQMTDLQRVYNQ